MEEAPELFSRIGKRYKSATKAVAVFKLNQPKLKAYTIRPETKEVKATLSQKQLKKILKEIEASAKESSENDEVGSTTSKKKVRPHTARPSYFFAR
jgi:hypothetical protein